MKKRKAKATPVGGLTIYLGPELYEQLNRIREERGISKTFMIKEALKKYLAEWRD